MDRYCVWCEEPIIQKRTTNKLYCSDQCFNERHTAVNHNEGLGPADYKDHANGAREQGLPEGGLPWEVQHALDLAEKGEKVIYLLHGVLELPSNKTLAESAITKKHIYSGT